MEQRTFGFGITCTFQSSLIPVMQFWQRKIVSAACFLSSTLPIEERKILAEEQEISGKLQRYGVQMLHVSPNKYEVWVMLGYAFL